MHLLEGLGDNSEQRDVTLTWNLWWSIFKQVFSWHGCHAAPVAITEVHGLFVLLLQLVTAAAPSHRLLWSRCGQIIPADYPVSMQYWLKTFWLCLDGLGKTGQDTTVFCLIFAFKTVFFDIFFLKTDFFWKHFFFYWIIFDWRHKCPPHNMANFHFVQFCWSFSLLYQILV